MSTTFELIRRRQFHELRDEDCQQYLVKLHLMHHHLVNSGKTESLIDLKSILSRYHHNIDTLLPYIQLDLNAVSQQMLAMNFDEPRNKSQLDLEKEFENGTPDKRVLMIFEELYHFSKGSKAKLYFGNSKFFLCRWQEHQDLVRLIVVLLFYVPCLPLQAHEVMDVVLSHCKSRLEFTAYVFCNVPMCVTAPLIRQLVDYTEKQIVLSTKAKQANHAKRIESTGKQIEIMKRIFRNLASFSPYVARQIQHAIASTQICPEIYMELCLSLQQHSFESFIGMFCDNLTNAAQQQYLWQYLKTINHTHPMIQKLNLFLDNAAKQFHRRSVQSMERENDKMEQDSDEHLTSESQHDTAIAVDTMEQLINVYLMFASSLPNIELDSAVLSNLLRLMDGNTPYRLLAPLMLFLVLCPRVLQMEDFSRVCVVFARHPIFDIDCFMLVHHVSQQTYQSLFGVLRAYTKLPTEIHCRSLQHLKELKQSFLSLPLLGGGVSLVDSDAYIGQFFASNTLLDFEAVQRYVQRMSTLSDEKLDASVLYLAKLQRYLSTAQSMLQNEVRVAKMDEWIFNVLAASCVPNMQTCFPSICLSLFKLMDRCAMITSRTHLDALMASTRNRSKIGVEMFYDYIRSELDKTGSISSIHRFTNPLQMVLCVYFALLSNHRFYKLYTSNHGATINHAAAAATETFMSDGSDVVMKDLIPPLPPRPCSFVRASQLLNGTHSNKRPPFPIEMLCALPITGCIEYLRVQATDVDVDTEQIHKSIEKCIYLMRHHYAHWLYWLDLKTLLVTPKFEFLHFGLNLDLMADRLYFPHFLKRQNLRSVHESFVKDFVENRRAWTENVSFEVPQCFFASITEQNVELLPVTVEAADLDRILQSLAAAFEGNDLAHFKWQYLLCFWWHKYGMYQPLCFLCRSLQPFMRGSTVLSIRKVLKNPDVLLNIDERKYPSIWSNVWFLNVYIRAIHLILTASQGFSLSFNADIYSTFANNDARNGDKTIPDQKSKDLRQLIMLKETLFLETLIKNVERGGNQSCVEIVVELLLWRHCQSLSQGKCYEASSVRNVHSQDEKLQRSLAHKNFPSFQQFICRIHEQFGFDVISVLLQRGLCCSFVAPLIQDLVRLHHNDWNVLHEYQAIVIAHFEAFSDRLMTEGVHGRCLSYFNTLSDANEPWLFAVTFVVEAVILTHDQKWVDCLRYVMQEISDILQIVSNHANADEKAYLVKNTTVRRQLVGVVNSLWSKMKRTKYTMDGYVLKRLCLALENPIHLMQTY